MRFWFVFAAAALAVLAYGLFYAITASEGQGAMSLGLANVAGLAAVMVGLLGAVLLLRRGAPPPKSGDSRNP